MLSRDAWERHLEWRARQPRWTLALLNLSRDEAAGDGWRIISGQIGIAFGLMLVVFGVLGAADALANAKQAAHLE